MKTHPTFKTLLLLVLLVAAGGFGQQAKAQYQSFFGDSITEYNTIGDPVNYCAEYDSQWLGADTYVFHIRKTDTILIDGKCYYEGRNNFAWPVYIREDTSYGRIYRYAPEGEILICDMSLSVGDTFWMPFTDMNSGYANNRTPLPIIADTVFYINELKYIQFRTIYEEYGIEMDGHGHLDTIVYPIPYLYGEWLHEIPILFIEGIGPNFGPEGANWLSGGGGCWFESGQLEWWPNPFLLCVHKDGELVFMSDERAGCWQYGPANVKENDDIGFTLYPNPVHNTLNIKLENALVSNGVLFITDMVGRVICSQKVWEQNVRINVKNLQSGLYIATWVTGGKKQSVKFVKK